MSDVFLTSTEVAALLKVKIDTVYALAAKGVLPGAKVGGQWRFVESHIRQWFEARSQALTSASPAITEELKQHCP